MSFEFEINDSDRAKSEIIGTVGRDLQALFSKRKREEGLTQQKVAEAVGVDKSRINRCLTGYANLTLGTVAELSQAMRGRVVIRIIPDEEASFWVIHSSSPNKITNSNGSVIDGRKSARSDTQEVKFGAWR